jgi:hypothetical protein
MRMRIGEVGSNSWTPEDLSQWSSLDLQNSCWACMFGGLKSFRVQGLWNLLANLILTLWSVENFCSFCASSLSKELEVPEQCAWLLFTSQACGSNILP